MRDRYLEHYQQLRNAIANLPDNPQTEGSNVLLSKEQFDELKALKDVA